MKKRLLSYLTLSLSTALLCAQPLAKAQQLTRSTSSFTSQQAYQPLAIGTAFPFTLSLLSPASLRVNWAIADAHYLYGHQFSFHLKTADSIQPVEFTLPAGIERTDEFFGDIVAYYGDTAIDLELPTDAAEDSLLVIEFQGCAEWGFCYPPQRVEYPL